MENFKEAQKPVLALFDFDGTITSRDSFIEFIRFCKGSLSLYFGFFLLFPALILMKLKLVPNWKVKEWAIIYFFGNTSSEVFQKKCTEFAEKALPQLIKPNANNALQKHTNEGHRVILVSASPENYLQTWCKQQNIELIGTRLEQKDGKITGKIDGKNCYGQEKVNRIRSLLNTNDYTTIYAYGDSNGDREMLALSTNPNYRVF